MNRPNTVIIDNGTGFTKMGYAGNEEPTYTIPTAISDHVDKGNVLISRLKYDQLDFHIGNDALKTTQTHALTYPGWGLKKTLKKRRKVFFFRKKRPKLLLKIIIKKDRNTLFYCILVFFWFFLL